MLIEQEFVCSNCWQTGKVMLDLSVRSQTFIQDCEVCCSPMEFRYEVSNGGLVSFEYESAGG